MLPMAFACDTACAADLVHLLSPAKMPSQQNLAMLGMQVFVALWIFVLGSCFGSFLNVVIYRMPAGLSLGKPKSRCPRCETSLAAKDNIPVLGWLMLKGKCRYCSLPIAARYPIIEATCGLVFLGLMFGELLIGAANLPVRPPDTFHINPGFWLVWFAKWDLSGIFFFHCCLLVVVLATVMIGFDGHKPQPKLMAFAIIVALVCGTMWPDLHAVSAAGWPESLSRLQTGFIWQDFMQPPNRLWTGVTLLGFLDGLAGIAGGLVFGTLVSYAASSSSSTSVNPDQRNVLPATLQAAFVIVGGFLGWQASGMMAVLMLPVIVVLKLTPKCCPGLSVHRIVGPVFFLMLFAFILTWEKLDSATWMIGISGWQFGGFVWWQDWLATIVVIAVVAALLHQLSPGELAEEERELVKLGPQIDNTSPNTTES